MRKKSKKGIKKITILMFIVVISLAGQTGILYYVNNYYLSSNKQYIYKPVNVNSTAKRKQVKVEDTASKFALSESGNYCSYYYNNKFYVVSLLDGTKNEVKLNKDISNYCFKWGTEDRIILSEKSTEKGRTGIRIYYYIPKKNQLIQSVSSENVSRLYNLPYDSSVTDIETHTINTIMYLKTTNKSNINYLTRLDISDNNNKMNLNTKRIGNFFVIKQLDELVYESTSDGKIYLTGDNYKRIKVSDADNLKLLAVDKDDNVYVGKIENKMITKIYKNNFYNNDNIETTWKSYSLANPTDEDNIHITYSGQMYVVDNLKGTVKNLGSGAATTFNGIFLDINYSGVLTLNEQKLSITKCK